MLTSVQIIGRDHRRKGNNVVLHKKCKNNSCCMAGTSHLPLSLANGPKNRFFGVIQRRHISPFCLIYIFLFLASVSFHYIQEQIAALCVHSVCTMCTYLFTNKTASVNWRQNGLVPVCIIHIHKFTKHLHNMFTKINIADI
jgi:hypothetical protein